MLIDDRNMTYCDHCNREFFQDNLINIDPAITPETNDLKKEYKNFDGMVCGECYYMILANDNVVKEDRDRVKNMSQKQIDHMMKVYF